MSDRGRAAAGSLVFLLLAPGVMAGVIPWLLTGWAVNDALAWPPVQVLGAVLIASGVAVLVHAFARFVLEGTGTPAPIAPPQTLVVGGLYRHVRNPMYVAIAATIIGQALLLGRPVLLACAALFMAVVATFVHLYEEPTLTSQFGDDYAAYRRSVPAWRPRLHPWRAGES